MAKVSLKSISKVYPGGKKQREGMAVSDVTLEIESREFVTLTGPAGSGKTTLLRMIAGLEEASQGDIYIGDRKVNGLKPKERDVAMVFPQDALYPAMSVRENITFGLKLRKFSSSEITRRVEDSSATLVIADLLELRPQELSPAQRQRVSIARAIARQPKVLLFDDALANLDRGARAEMRAEIRKLHERLQTTVIYSTGDASEAIALGERLVVLSAGSVQQNDLVRGVYDTPANLFVAGFVGAPPMNFVRGTLKLEPDSLLFCEADEGTIQARIPLSEHPAAREHVGKPILLGVRPEDVEIATAVKGQENPALSSPAVIDFVETNGAETDFHLQTGAHTIVCRVFREAEQDWPAGRRVRFRFTLEKAHLFDPVSTRRIA